MNKIDIRAFTKKNLVFIIMVPTILAAHYGWFKLQEVDALVKPSERDRLNLNEIGPTFMKKVKSIFNGD